MGLTTVTGLLNGGPASANPSTAVTASQNDRRVGSFPVPQTVLSPEPGNPFAGFSQRVCTTETSAQTAIGSGTNRIDSAICSKAEVKPTNRV